MIDNEGSAGGYCAVRRPGFFNIFMGGALWGLQERAYIVYNSMEIIINSFKGVEYE